MNRLIALILRHGVSFVAANVFLEQIGAPIPAVPSLIVAGALTRTPLLSSTHVLIWSVAASLVADTIWFLLGRYYGYRILRTLCRLSLSPDSCVRDTETNFERWGMKSLLIAKFIPGFSTVAPPLAGATRRGTLEFLLYDGIGAAIWAGSAIAIGRAFHRAIARILDSLENLGWWAIFIAATLLALFVIFKWWQRVRFIRQLRVARMQPHDLKTLLDEGQTPLIVDVRTEGARRRDPRRIPTAIVATAEELEERLRNVDPATEIVLYCT